LKRKNRGRSSPDHRLEDAFQEPQLKTSALFVSSGASA
jgi:hypothetical protein